MPISLTFYLEPEQFSFILIVAVGGASYKTIEFFRDYTLVESLPPKSR